MEKEEWGDYCLLSIVFTSTAYKASRLVVEVAANDMNVLQH